MKLNMDTNKKTEMNHLLQLSNKMEILTNINKDMIYSNHDLETLLRFQLEYHFSDENLKMDNYLLSQMHKDPNYWVPVKVVANLTKIKSLVDDEQMVLNAIRKSRTLVLNEDETKVKRPHFEPPKPKQHKDLRRTVFLYGLPFDASKEFIMKLCSIYGQIKAIILDCPSDMPNNSCVITESSSIAAFAPSSFRFKDPNYKALSKNLALADVINPEKKEQQKMEKENEEEGTREEANGHESGENAEEDDDENEEDEEEEIEPPDRETAVIVMRRKLGARINPIDRETAVTTKEHIANISKDVNTRYENNINKCVTNEGIITTPSFSYPIPSSNANSGDCNHFRTAFVVFRSQSQANKCVRGRMRSCDGIRAMHQYDFNKQRKKASVNKARGMSPLFGKESSYTNSSHAPSFAASPSLCGSNGQFNLPSPLLRHQSQNLHHNEAHFMRPTTSLYKSRSARHVNNREVHVHGGRGRTNGKFYRKGNSYPRVTDLRKEYPSITNLSFSRSNPSPHCNEACYYNSCEGLANNQIDISNWGNMKPIDNIFTYQFPIDKERAQQILAVGPDPNGSKGFDWPRNHRPRETIVGGVLNTVPMVPPFFSFMIPSNVVGLNVMMPIAPLSSPTAPIPIIYTPTINTLPPINKQ